MCSNALLCITGDCYSLKINSLKSEAAQPSSTIKQQEAGNASKLCSHAQVTHSHCMLQPTAVQWQLLQL
jgi:hypothetical protein